MKKVAVFLAQGFEEVEAITPIDLLRRAGVHVDVVGVGSKEITAARGVSVNCDIEIEDIEGSYDCLVVPGGMPGSVNLSQSKKLSALLTNQNDNNRLIGAICAAPGVVLGSLSILDGKNFTCYPGNEDKVKNGNFKLESVVVSGNIVTSRGVGTAIEFSLKLIEILVSKDVSTKISKGIIYS